MAADRDAADVVLTPGRGRAGSEDLLPPNPPSPKVKRIILSSGLPPAAPLLSSCLGNHVSVVALSWK